MRPNFAAFLRVLPLVVFALASTSCDARLARQFRRLTEAFEFVLIVFGVCCGALFLVMIVGGLVTLGLNISRPTPATRRLGLALGVANGLWALVLLGGLLTSPPRHDAVETRRETVEVADQQGRLHEEIVESSVRRHGEGELDLASILTGLACGGSLFLLGLGVVVAGARARPRSSG